MTTKMYQYFYQIDEVLGDAQPSFNFKKFTEALKDTLWQMGEALWMVDDDP